MAKQIWSRSSRLLVLIPWIALLGMIGLGIFGDDGILQLYQLDREQEKLKASISEQQTINAELRREVYRLRTDQHYLEKLARDDLGLVRPGEIVFQFDAPGY